MILKIAQLGNPVLRQEAKSLGDEEIVSGETKGLIGAMISTLRDAGGVGLAAPQVHVSKRLFIAYIGNSDQEPDRLEVFINPKIVDKSEEIESEWEGCLSFTELQVYVPRSVTVTVEYQNIDGEDCKLDLDGYWARVVQHEYDHLDGTLIIDRAASTKHIVKSSELHKVDSQSILFQDSNGVIPKRGD